MKTNKTSVTQIILPGSSMVCLDKKNAKACLGTRVLKWVSVQPHYDLQGKTSTKVCQGKMLLKCVRAKRFLGRSRKMILKFVRA